MKIALSGASGFLGSGLAARLLSEGHEVLALSRNDPTGERTRRASAEAAAGMGISLGQRGLERLVVRNIDFQDLAATLDPSDFADIDLVWHAAAEMSYAPAKLEAAFAQNLRGSSLLYRWISTHAPACRRFYFVSTAYTAGLDQAGAEVKEEIHTAPRLLNVYQASKWAAEMSLTLEAHKSTLPLTLFRPSVIIGAEGSGWNAGKDFGMYSIVRVIIEAKRQGAKQVSLPFDARAQNNIIPVNRVVDIALALSERAESGRETEIFHVAAARPFDLLESLSIVSGTLAMPVNLGPPQSLLDREIFSRMGHNRIFTGKTWHFSQTQLASALATKFTPYELPPAALKAIIHPYIAEKLALPRPAPLQAAAKAAIAGGLAWAGSLGVSIRFERPRLAGLLTSDIKSDL